MIIVSINKPGQLLYVCFIGHVKAEQVAHASQTLPALLSDLAPGFRMLADLGRLDSMDIDCASEIGKVMDLCDQKGIAQVIRVIPDSRKDIGLSIISRFHYKKHPKVIVCETILEAERLLAH